MPELPDIEYFKKYFNRTSLNREIKDVKSNSKKLIKKTSFKNFRRHMKNNSFEDSKRRGKFLIASLNTGSKVIIFHFGMTGDLKYLKTENRDKYEDEIKFSRVRFEFKNGYELNWLNMRKLGNIYLVDNPRDVDLINRMGPEPLDIKKDKFMDLLQENSRKGVKSFFMHQDVIAGVGNIYSDEILFKTGLRPSRKVASLEEKQKKSLFDNMKEVLKKAIAKQPPTENFGSSWLLTHRKDRICPNNSKHNIERKKVGGRSTYYCPDCQK
ncbi:MAG: Fpg/Nei family DNA glycosylase [Elusimicrobiota bacterium]